MTLASMVVGGHPSVASSSSTMSPNSNHCDKFRTQAAGFEEGYGIGTTGQELPLGRLKKHTDKLRVRNRLRTLTKQSALTLSRP